MQPLLHQFFDLGQQQSNALDGSHQWGLVLLSYLVAVLASYTSLLVIERILYAERKRARIGWLWTSALIGGIGVWSMHFIGMLAFEINIPMTHSIGLTLVSIVPAILGNLLAFHTQVNLHSNALKLPTKKMTVFAGVILGAGIGLMHYTGMAAMVVPATLVYDPLWFAISIVVAVALGIIALLTYRKMHQHLNGKKRLRQSQVGVAAIIGAAISGMHYTAMLAARFYSDSTQIDQVHAHSNWLVYAVTLGAVATAITAIIATRIDKRLQQQQAQMRMSGEQLFEVIEAIDDGLVLFEKNGKVLLFNDAFARLTGFEHTTLMSAQLSLDDYAVDADLLKASIEKQLRNGKAWQGEIKAKTSTGSTFPARLAVSKVNYRAANAASADQAHYVATMSDLTLRVEADERIRRLAYNDALTGLANRRLLHDQLQDIMARCAPLPGTNKSKQIAALILIDIDKFKVLNNTLGSDMGDLLLVEVANRLREQLCPGDHIARFGGNEFAYIITDDATQIDSTNFSQRVMKRVSQLQHQLRQPYQLGSYNHICSTSAGVALFASCDGTVESIVSEASLALAQAKKQADGHAVLFRPEFSEAVTQRVTLETELRHAITQRALNLHWQAQVGPEGKVIGAEALVRWQHPERGWISPADFIPLAEDSGLILPLGHWVMEQACRQLKEWRDDPQLSQLQLSVNVSVRQFQQPDFVEDVHQLIVEYGIIPNSLKFELTESLLMEDVDSIIEKMLLLKKVGIDFALDDFGTGYSSMSYLMRLPFNTLKIDVSFVRNMLENPTKAAIVRTIIALADSLHLDVIAEGVETEAQQAYLESFDCKIFQGYLFGRPGPAAELIKLVKGAPLKA